MAQQTISNISNNELETAINLCPSNPEEAYRMADNQYQQFILNKNERGMFESKMVMAHAGQFLGMYALSYQMAIECKSYFEKINSDFHVAFILNTLGFIYNYFDDHVNRLDVNLKSLAIRRELGDSDGYSRSLNNTGDTYLKLQQYENAIPYFEEAQSRAGNNMRLLSVINSNMAEAYFYLNDTDKAESFFEKAIDVAEKINFQSIIFNSYIFLGTIELRRNTFDKANLYFKKASDTIDENEASHEELSNLNRVWGNYYEKTGDFKNAVHYFKQFYFTEEKIKSVKQEKEFKSIQFSAEINELKSQKKMLEMMVNERTIELENTLSILTMQEMFNRSILNSSQHGIVVFNKEGEIINFNPAATDLFSQKIGSNIKEILYFTDENKFDSVLKLLFSPNTQNQVKFRFDMKADVNDTTHYLDVSFTQIEDNSDQKGIAFIHDVSYRVNAEKERKIELETEITINLFAQSLFKANSVDEILWGLAKDCIARLGFVDCVIYLLDEQTGELIQKAAHGPKNPIDFDIHNPIRIKLGHGIVGTVAKTGVPEMISDTSQDERYIIDDDMRLSEIAIPIKLNDKVIGVIDSEHPQKDFYSDKHLRILTTISKLVANRIDKLKEQEEKEKLQAEILKINISLEEQVRVKTLENISLNKEIQDIEKNLMLGEMATLLAHEMNTPLANIKNASSALIDIHTNELNQLFVQLEGNSMLGNIIHNAIYQPPELLSSKKFHARQQSIQQMIQSNSLANLNGFTNELTRLNIVEIEELKLLNDYSGALELIPSMCKFRQINSFNEIIKSGVQEVSKVILEVQSLKHLETNEQKKWISIQEGLDHVFHQVHVDFANHVHKRENSIKQIFGIQFKLIQLWNAIHRIVYDHCKLNDQSNITIDMIEDQDHKVVQIRYFNIQIDQSIFNENLDFNSYSGSNHSMKVKLSFIKTILVEHNATMHFEHHNDALSFHVSFLTK
jgi:PAS domain S-box-containing protein